MLSSDPIRGRSGQFRNLLRLREVSWRAAAEEDGQYCFAVMGWPGRAQRPNLLDFGRREAKLKEEHAMRTSHQRMSGAITTIGIDVPGIGPITSSAMVAAISNGAGFKQGRDFGAWLELVPK